MREHRLWTVPDVARLTGLHHATIYRAEAGSIRLRRSTLERITEVLADGEAEAHTDLVKLAGGTLVSDGDSRLATRRERRRDARRDRSKELGEWRRVWSKLGVRVKVSR